MGQHHSTLTSSSIPGAWWHRLPQEQRHALVAVVVALTAAMMLVGMLPGASGSWMGALGKPATALLGWGTAFALGGTIAWCIAVVADAMRDHPRLRSGRAKGAAVALALLLVESYLLFGSPTGGQIGSIGAALLHLLPQPAAQLALLGGLLLDILIVFRISWHDVRMVAFAVDQSTRVQGPIVPVLTPPPADDAAAFIATRHRASRSPAATPRTTSRPRADTLPPLPSRPAQIFQQSTVTMHPAAQQVPSAMPALPPADDALPRDLHIPAYLRRGALAKIPTLPQEAFAIASSSSPDGFALPPLPSSRSARNATRGLRGNDHG